MLKANKGNATVVMNSTNCDAKVISLLNDKSTSIKLATKFDPINHLISNVNKSLQNLFKTNRISKACSYFLRCTR